MPYSAAKSVLTRTVEIDGGLVTISQHRGTSMNIVAHQSDVRSKFNSNHRDFLLRFSVEGRVLAYEFIALSAGAPVYDGTGFATDLGSIIIRYRASGNFAVEFNSAYPEILPSISKLSPVGTSWSSTVYTVFLELLTDCINHDYLVNYTG